MKVPLGHRGARWWHDASTVGEPLSRLILDSLPVLVSTVDAGGRVQFANQPLLTYLGVGLDDLGDWPAFVHDADRDGVRRQWAEAFAAGHPFDADYRLRRADGVYRWVHGRAVPGVGPSASGGSWCHVMAEIEDRRRAEDERRSSALHAILDNIPTLISIHSAAGQLELYNRAARDYHGPSVADPKTWDIADIIHPDDLPDLLVARRRGVETGRPFDTEPRMRRHDGEYRWFHVRAVRVNDYDGQVRWYGVRTDIHDRKLAENALRQSEAFLLEVQRLSRAGGWRFDPATGLVESSAEIQRAYAVEPHEDISRPAFWFGRIHPDDRSRVQAEFERCLHDKAEYRMGYRIVLPDGSIRYQYATGQPVTNEAGELLQVIGASMDMTEHWLETTQRSRAEEALRRSQAELAHVARIASLGEMTASIAHEVNQPLAAVVANGHACLRWLSGPQPNISRAVEAAERIVKDGKDAGEVVRRVRALVRRTAVDKVRLDLRDVIAEVLRLLDAYPAREQVALDVKLAPDLPPIFADRVQLQQLVLNLAVNALEALAPVTGRARQLSVRLARAEDQAVLQIRDNGIGLDDSVAAFEPFVTTKPEGMGLGLAICRSIVAAHEGRLSAEHNQGFGMTFTVALPLAREASS